jgi:uncharacterized protein
MPRPPKCRFVSLAPNVTYYKPRGIPMSSLQETVLTIDEFEALRLADLKAHSHAEAAAKMKISRATFGRIIEKARHTVSDALVNGKAILIEGGNYRAKSRLKFHCRDCKCRWKFVNGADNKNCPRCRKIGQAQ